MSSSTAALMSFHAQTRSRNLKEYRTAQVPTLECFSVLVGCSRGVTSPGAYVLLIKSIDESFLALFWLASTSLML